MGTLSACFGSVFGGTRTLLEGEEEELEGVGGGTETESAGVGGMRGAACGRVEDGSDEKARVLHRGGDTALLRRSCWRIAEVEGGVGVKGRRELTVAGTRLEGCEAVHCSGSCAAQPVLLAISLIGSGFTMLFLYV